MKHETRARTTAGYGTASPPPAANATTTRLMTAAMPADRSRVTLHLQPGSGAQGQIALTPNGLLRLIQTLGRVHTAMSAGKKVPLDVAAAEAVLDPDWHIGPGLTGEATTISFQHPGYGAVSFSLPNDQARAIADALDTSLAAAGEMRRAPQA